MKTPKTYFKSAKRGYTLLFAILVAVTVVGVAAFILSVSRKQFILSSVARDSMYSIYAASRGIECALPALNTVTTAGGSMSCNGQQGITFTFTPVGAKYVSNSAPILFTDTGQCAIVTITLSLDSQGRSIRTFDSSGYNVSCSVSGNTGAPLVTPRTVERELEVTLFYNGAITP